MNADITCGSAVDGQCISVAGTIQVTYSDLAIDNDAATGITVCETLSGVSTCNAAGTYLAGAISAGNSPQGGVVSFGTKGGANFAVGDQIRISGVRARIDQSPLAVPGRSAVALLASSPETAAAFSPTSNIVARSADPLSIAVVPDPLVPCAAADPPAGIRITEEFPTAFVDYGDPEETTYPGLPIGARPLFGATNSTRIGLVLSGLVSGIAVNWPASVSSLTGAAVLDRVTQSPDGSTAVYVFGAPDQGLSDAAQEIFDLQLTSANFTFSGQGSIFGDVTLQGQMLPPATPATVRPRYNHPLEPIPAAEFLGLRRCNTTTGALSVRADVDGVGWSGNLNFRLLGPSEVTGDHVPAVYEGMLAGTYTLEYLSGGPSGTTYNGFEPTGFVAIGPNSTGLFQMKFLGTASLPAFTAAGVTNGASFTTGITAGSIASLTGSHLSPEGTFLQAGSLPLPTQLGGVSVTIGGFSAPLFAISNVNGKEQIIFQVPWQLALLASPVLPSIIVNNNGLASSPVMVSLLPASPGIFTIDGTAGVILHGTNSTPVTSNDPARPGEVVQIIATGLGLVTATPPTGSPALSDPLSLTAILPAVTVGGRLAEIQSSALLPGSVGLYRVSVVLPTNLSSGNQDVTMTVSGQTSKAVKIPIR